MNATERLAIAIATILEKCPVLDGDTWTAVRITITAEETFILEKLIEPHLGPIVHLRPILPTMDEAVV